MVSLLSVSKWILEVVELLILLKFFEIVQFILKEIFKVVVYFCNKIERRFL